MDVMRPLVVFCLFSSSVLWGYGEMKKKPKYRVEFYSRGSLVKSWNVDHYVYDEFSKSYTFKDGKDLLTVKASLSIYEVEE